MNKKKVIIIVVCIVVLWITAGIVDFTLVSTYHKPLFCIGVELADDGGSGKYVGLGYSFDIEGNFVAEVERRGITSYRGYIFGIEVSRGFWEAMLPTPTRT